VEEIGKSLPIIFKRHIRRSDPALAEILAPLWARVAGRAIAEHSRPVAFEAGQLILETSCETWAGQLRQMSAQLIEAVNLTMGAPAVKELSVRVRAGGPVWDAKRQLKLHAPDSREPLIAGFETRDGAESETSRVVARSYAKYFSRGAKRPD
jgi:hypothetical protein